MTLSSGLRRLAAVVDELERANVGVRDATVEPDAGGQDCVHATLALSIPVDDDTAGTEISIESAVQDTDAHAANGGADETTANGDTHSSTESVAITSTLEGAGGESDGTIQCPETGCDASFESEPGMKVHRTKVHLSGDDEADDLPAYRDPERLAAVYEAEDTFPEMRDALGADVSAQTVRRHMIRHDIHDPDAAAGGDDADGDSNGPADERPADDLSVDEVVAADLDVPPDIELGDLRACVQAADTLYDVQQAFDLDRETAREVLAAFDLLELVHGRVATKHERDELKAEIDRRIDTALQTEPS